jgi:hypothetical protein
MQRNFEPMQAGEGLAQKRTDRSLGKGMGMRIRSFRNDR